MSRDANLLIPGPTPLPPDVRAAMARPMVNHRGPEFGALLAEVLSGLQRIFQTTAPVLPFAASGTGGLEAAVVNVLSPGDRVLALCCGAFGERFAAIAQAFGAEVIRADAPWGQGFEPDAVARALAQHRGVKAVLVTHNETSTGVTNELEALAAAVRPSGALLLVDAVSSLGAIEVRTDAWGLDVVVTGSQKALMGPPGAVFISVSDRAWEAVGRSRMPRHYFSFADARQQLSDAAAFTAYTPVVPVLFALQVSVRTILQEGLAARFAHHRRLARAVRDGIRALGLGLFAQPRWASDTVTAAVVPAGVQAAELLRRLRTDFGVILAGGQGRLDGQIVRIGHMGYVQPEQILDAVDALEHALVASGHRPRAGAGVEAAARVLHSA